MARSKDIKNTFNPRTATSPFSHFDPAHDLERCIVNFVNTEKYTVEVRTESGKTITSVPWPSSAIDPSFPAGEIYVPKLGQQFYIFLKADKPTLICAAHTPLPKSLAGTRPAPSAVTGGENSNTNDLLKGIPGPDYSGNKPRDLLPGDWLRVGADQNLIGVLEGGLTVLKASELCQIIANKAGDLLKIIGRELDIYSDFGEISFKNNDGRTTLSIRGGMQQTTESSPLEENFTIQADLGGEGDIVDFRILSPSGDPLYSYHIDPDGRMQVHTSSSSEEIVEGDKTSIIGGNYRKKVEGDQLSDIDGSETKNILGSSSKEVGGSLDLTTAAGSVNIASGQDLNTVVSRNSSTFISGNATARPGAIAKATTVSNGSYLIDIGNPTAGDLQAAKSGFKVKTTMGDIEASTRAGDITASTNLGEISLQTTKFNSVHLGGQRSTATAMKFEAFEKYIQALHTALDTHIHQTAVGPTTPPTPLVSTLPRNLVGLIKSMYVKLGG